MKSKKMMSEAEYRKISRQVKSLTTEAARSEGILDRLMSELEEDYDVSSLEKAEALLDQLEMDLETDAAELQAAETKFKEKWGEVLRNED